MAWRISCVMIRSSGALASVLAVACLGGCRGEVAAPIEPPKAAVSEPSPRKQPDEHAPPLAGTQEPSMTTPPRAPRPANEPPGPPLAAADVVPTFQRWWNAWAPEHLASHPLRDRFDELVAADGHAKPQACDELAEHVSARAPAGSPERLFGDPAALRGRGDRCWWLHHDGMMGAGVGAALASDGTVLVVWIVSEG